MSIQAVIGLDSSTERAGGGMLGSTPKLPIIAATCRSSALPTNFFIPGNGGVESRHATKFISQSWKGADTGE